MDVLRRGLRWVLRADAPTPDWSEEERLAYQQRHLRANFTIHVADGAAFWLGMGFASSATVLPLFVSKLTGSKLALGIVAAMAASGWLLPQIFTANFVERLPHKKAIVVNLGLFAERLPVCLWPVAAMLAASHPLLALWLFVLFHAWHCLGAGVVATGWQELVSNCLPTTLRGRMLGLQVFFGSGMGIIGARYSASLLRDYPFPTNFVWCFALCALGIMVSELILAQAREPVDPRVKEHQSHGDFWRELPSLLRGDRVLCGFLTARMLGVLGNMGLGFLTVSAADRWHVPDAVAGYFTAALLVGQAVGNLLLGFLADRWGHKLSLQLGMLCAAAAWVLAFAAPSPAWYYPAFVLLGAASGASFVSGILMALELAVPERRATYAGLVNTIIGMVGLVAPLLGAGLAQLGYGPLFAVSAVCQVAAAVVMTVAVVEPRDKAVAV